MNKYTEQLKKLERILNLENPNKLDIELAKTILINLYNQIVSFEINSIQQTEKPKLQQDVSGTKEENKPEESTESHDAQKLQEPEIETNTEQKPQEKIEPQKNQTPTNESAAEQNEITATPPSTNNDEPPQIKETQVAESHTTTISDKLGNNSKATLYDMIREIKNDTDLVTYLANKPVENISKAISLNEKIMFIKELFEGNSEKYSKAIDDLNNAGNLENALDILASYEIDTSKESAAQLIRILYRKYAV